MYATASDATLAQPGPFGSIYLKNYKAFGPSGQTLPLSRINLFFGPNSSGKSSVFKAIRLAVKSFFGESLSDYAYSTTVHKGKRDEQIVIGLCFRHPHGSIDSTPRLLFYFSERPEDHIGLDNLEVILPSRVALQLKPSADGLLLDSCALSLDTFRQSIPLTHQDMEDDALDKCLTTLKKAVSASQCPLDKFHPKLRFLAKADAIPQEIVSALEAAIAEGLFTVSDNLGHLQKNLVHLPPIRRIPVRSELLKLSQSNTSFLEDVEARVWEVLLKPRFKRFLEETNFWMGEKGLCLGYELLRKVGTSAPDDNAAAAAPDSDPYAYLVVRDTTDPLMSVVDLDLTDVGVGISQVIPAIGAACVHDELWIMLEQPELHLHPRIQCQLGDLFIAKSKDDLFLGNHNSGNVFFVETHSEHLILRMLRRVRETNSGILKGDHPFSLKPADLSVFYFEPHHAKGVKVHKMEVTSEGDFDQPWPQGFFSERLAELR